MAEVEAEAPVYTTVSVYADKEEVGSNGNTGMQSKFFENTLAKPGSRWYNTTVR